jgi:hypothetical protein
MPVSSDCPEPLRAGLLAMERIMQSTKKSLAYAAPEMVDPLWANLQEGMATEMTVLYGRMGGK